MSVLAAILQVLTAVAFVSVPMVRRRYGAMAQTAMEAELQRQGVPASVVAANKIKLDASGIETSLPVAVAAVLIVVAGFNLLGSSIGEILTWIAQPIVLLIDLAFLYSQVTAANAVTAWFAKTGAPELQNIDVPAVLKASEGAFPRWVVPGLQNTAHVVVILGSVAILALMLTN